VGAGTEGPPAPRLPSSPRVVCAVKQWFRSAWEQAPWLQKGLVVFGVLVIVGATGYMLAAAA
jgi:hypothetical protein